MLDDVVIGEAVKRAVEAATAPAKVIVFGSYGRGDAREDSDLDLLVIEADMADRLMEYGKIRGAIGRVAPGVGVDLLLCTQNDFDRRSSVPGTVYYWARHEGRVFYDAAA